MNLAKPRKCREGWFSHLGSRDINKQDNTMDMSGTIPKHVFAKQQQSNQWTIDSARQSPQGEGSKDDYQLL